MATFVICHGAWDGGWFWKEPASCLRSFGHEVYTPTLTGLGERVHLATPAIDLETHIQDIVNLISYEDLQQVILVGHSYGGMVVTGAADRVPERIKQLVYLDAYVPENGQSLADLVAEHPSGGTVNRQMLDAAKRYGDGWKVPFLSHPPYDARVAPHPLKTFLDRIDLRESIAFLEIPRTFILCTGRGTNPLYDPIDQAAVRAKTRRWRVYEMASGHHPNLTKPREIAALLHEIG
ncbi:alpha/beta hydrolase [Brevibacillus sp. SYP-B805]|uniref:alpha/beta fold hydrolase n=1 Tax=Brevibacillus sp. SYP-B805 TaxID=1578199 RepID=UPI0013EA37F7|nr:alpha/beta hydrolase [Brevibacillus sp. SYP-B805]NGQ96767.1 alpha/beta hydrolase [Brevibacillus sp. SYP-B805]